MTSDFCPVHPEYAVGACRPCQVHAEKILDGWSEERLLAERELDLEGWRDDGAQTELLALLRPGKRFRKTARAAGQGS